jgi:DNA-binding GntR family transcriptional regulator
MVFSDEDYTWCRRKIMPDDVSSRHKSCVMATHAQDYMRHDADFHLKLCEFAGNREIIRVMTHQREKLYRVVMALLERDSHQIDRSYREHVMIVEALQQGDGEQAAAQMHAHFESGKEMLLA